MSQTAQVEATQLEIGDPRYPQLNWLYDLWQERRGHRSMPARSEIGPAELKEVLPRVMIVDVTYEPLEFRYRLSGTAISTIHGQDFTGLSVRDLQPKIYSDLIWRHYCEVLERQVPTIYEVSLLNDFTRRHYARIILPLSAKGDRVDKLLVVDEHRGSLSEFFRDYRPLYGTGR
ncbi:MAG: PAS domain-containing protein [Kiloniellales bacterium]